MIETIGLISAVVMPLFNIPLIVRVVRRKCSDDISLVWAVGVWFCIVGLLPSSLRSADLVLRLFGVTNAVAFTGVLVTVLFYRRPRPPKP